MSFLDNIKARALDTAMKVASSERAQELLADPKVQELAGRAFVMAQQAQEGLTNLRSELKDVLDKVDAPDDMAGLKRALDRARDLRG